MFRIFKRAKSFHVSAASHGFEFEVARDTPILEAALSQGLAFPHGCRVGTCGSCKCRLVSGKIHELADFAFALSADELAQGFILACQSLPRANLVLDVPVRAGAVAGPPVVARSGRIAGLRRLTHDIALLEFAADEPIAYRAGQYFEFALPAAVAPAGSSEVRAYSFASAPPAAPTRNVAFHVRLVPGGAFTRWLHDRAQVGDVLSGRGPFGDLALHDAPAPILAIAGGSGLAPVKALLEAGLTEGAQRDVHFFFGARQQRDLYCASEIARIAAAWRGRFTFEPVLSDEPAESDWAGARGFVSDHAQRVLGERLRECHAYACGPPPMIDAVERVLRAAGVASEHFHFDRFFDRSHATKR
jgi:NAD(P)H-flavin reductase/ferredoxin